MSRLSDFLSISDVALRGLNKILLKVYCLFHISWRLDVDSEVQYYPFQSVTSASTPWFGNSCKRCKNCQVPSQYREQILDRTRIVASNGLPNHVYEQYSSGHEKNPNDACSQPVYMALSTNPTKGWQ